MLSQVDRVVAHADVSLNTELDVDRRARPTAAGAQGRTPRRRAHGRARRPARGHPARRPRRRRAPDVCALPGHRAARASAPTSPARAASPPTTATWPSCPRSATSIEATFGVALDDRLGRQLGQPRLGARRRATSAGSTTCASASRSCSGCEPLAPPADRRPAHRRLHPGRRGDRVEGQADAGRGATIAPDRVRRAPPRRPTGATRDRVIVALGRQDVDPDGLTAARRA